jgi:hypothetical protein
MKETNRKKEREREKERKIKKQLPTVVRNKD